jgi:cell division protein FtsQ
MENRDSRRSEKVRQRLKKESKTWINQASRRLTDPNISSKNNSAQTSSTSVSMSSQAEKRNHFFRIGWRLISFLLTAAFAFGLYQMWTKPEFRISEIKINGLQRINADEVLSALDLTGKRIFSIDPGAVKLTLERTFPELWDIKVHLIMPNQVSIQLLERQPMIAWDFSKFVLWVDAEGYLIPARNLEQDLLTIRADALPVYQLASEAEIDVDSLEIDRIVNIIRDKPQVKNSFQQSIFFAFPKKITQNLLTAILQLNAWMPDEKELLYEAIRGVGWQDARGWEVFIGSKLENINDKMLMYETIVRELDKQGIQPSLVSVEFLHAPYYRLGN